MRSRSYYAIAGSSCLLLLLACSSHSAEKTDERVDPTIVAVPEKQDEKKAEARPDEGRAGRDEGPVPSIDTGAHTGEEPDGDPELPTAPSSKPRLDGCKKGEMRFDGKCLSKKRVEKILEKRDEEVKQKVQDAKNPQQQANAAHDLLQQQIVQMEKTEDDLDEITVQLKEENAKKYGDPPDKNEDKR